MSFSDSLDELVDENPNGLLGIRPDWTRVRLKEVAKILNGYPFDSSRFNLSSGYPLIRIRDVVRGSTETFVESDFLEEFKITEGDLLVGMDGDFHCERWKSGPALLNQRVCKISPDESRYSIRFLRHVLPGYLKAINDRTPSVTVKHLSSKTIGEIPLPYMDLEGQEMLADFLDGKFAKLEESVEALNRVVKNLQTYRASVLKAACEGRLVPTEAELARQEGRDYETGSQLLNRSLETRRKSWNGKGKYKEAISPEETDSITVPEGWSVATADQLTSIITDGEHITPRRSESGNLLLSARNVQDGKLSLKNVDYVPDDEFERIQKRLVVQAGDVLLSCSGSVGRSTVVPPNIAFTLVRSVAVLKPLFDMGPILSYMLRSPQLKAQIIKAQTQTAQANIFQGSIKKLSFPLPPLAEQIRIVAEVERRLSVIDQLETTVTANLQRASRLRQSILQTAFNPSSRVTNI